MEHKNFPTEFELDYGCLKCPDCSLDFLHPGDCSCSCAVTRTYWSADDLTRVLKDEPLLLSLLKYRLSADRSRVQDSESANLVSSVTRAGKQVPIIDLDYNHLYVPSNTEGHAHLYLNVPISKWRWVILMIGLRVGRVVEQGYFIWSLRRGSNFVRIPGVPKESSREVKSRYGWVFPKRRKNDK